MTSVAHLVRAVGGMAGGGFPLAVLAVFKILAEAVVLAKAMFVSLLPLAIVRWTEGRGLLLKGMGPGLVLPVVEASRGLFSAVATSERLQTMAEGRAGEAVSSPVA